MAFTDTVPFAKMVVPLVNVTELELELVVPLASEVDVAEDDDEVWFMVRVEISVVGVGDAPREGVMVVTILLVITICPFVSLPEEEVDEESAEVVVDDCAAEGSRSCSTTTRQTIAVHVNNRRLIMIWEAAEIAVLCARNHFER